MKFKYKITENGNANVLTISGRLDTLSATELEKGIQSLIENPGTGLTIDIADLTYISSSGLRCFMRLFNGCKKANAKMIITGMQPAIREIFDLTGFSKAFEL